MKFIKYLVLALVMPLIITGCGSAGLMEHSDMEHGDIQRMPNGDLRETTSSIDILPSFLEDQPEIVRNAYIVASLTQEDLNWIPCYCGCGETANHQNNKHCFIYEIEEDGSVVWDDHGTRCGVCIETAVETAAMKQKGLSLSEIRNAIDEKYHEGYSAPTPTPMPM